MSEILDIVEPYITGPQGPAGTFVSATAKQLPAGAQPTVTMTGPETGKSIEFGLPKGDKGDKGAKGDPGSGSVNSVNGDLGPDITITPESIGAATAFGLQTLASQVGWRAPKSVKDFGAKGDGTADDGAAIQAALDAEPRVFFPAGVYRTARELKIPTGREVFGVWGGGSVIKAANSLSRHWNILTNSKNDREYRTDYNEYIYIHDLKVDGNYTARPTGGPDWGGNASGVFLSTVRYCIVERVTSVDAPLHCFAVDASRLAKPTETPDFMVPGPSQHVVIRDCVAIDPAIDDGFTTHYSSDILIDSCQAIRTKPVAVGAGIQNGFEVDEGSYRVTVRDSYASGWVYGVQIKGHDNTRPPWDILIENLVAEKCQNAALLSGTSADTTAALAGKAANVTLRNLTCLSTEDKGEAQTLPHAAIKVFSYRGVVIEGLTTRNSPHGGILIDKSGDITIDGVYGEGVFTAPDDPNDGFIRMAGGALGDIEINNVRVLNPIAGSLIRNNMTGSERLAATRLRATATQGAAFPLISESYQTPYRHYRDLIGVGFSKLIGVRSGPGSGSACESYGETSRGPGSPEGNVVAWPGYTYQSTNSSGGSALWVKNTGTAATGWKAL